MRIPKSVLINGNKWDVIQVENPVDDNGVTAMGICNYNEREIEIKKSLSKENKDLVYLHELCHSILYEYGIELDYDIDEAVVDAVSGEINKLFKLTKK